jgi:catechol 2,3-dioxygenase-like lactoylglutathione lyase family enzyme
LPVADRQASADSAHPTTAGLPPITGQVTFLYFNDLNKAAAFYGKTLGLRPTYDAGWVKLFTLSPTSSIGLVDATHGTHHPSADKPVMVSLVVDGPDQVDRWFSYMKGQGVALSGPRQNERSPTRQFGFKDPEGHTLEVFCWLKH